MSFPSLEEFLSLSDDPGIPHDRDFNAHRQGYAWLVWYRVAQASWNRWGDNGPPVGSKVITLVSGHGGRGCDHRTFGGVYEDDPRFFTLKRTYKNSYTSAWGNPGDSVREQLSLVNRSTWWRSITPLSPDNEMFARMIVTGEVMNHNEYNRLVRENKIVDF